MKGNLAIVNANVIPMADDKRFSAILVENGDIRALGTDSEIRALAAMGTKAAIVGKAVYTGALALPDVLAAAGEE